MFDQLAKNFGQPVHVESLGLASAAVYLNDEGVYNVFLVGDNLATFLGSSFSLSECVQEIKSLAASYDLSGHEQILEALRHANEGLEDDAERQYSTPHINDGSLYQNGANKSVLHRTSVLDSRQIQEDFRRLIRCASDKFFEAWTRRSVGNTSDILFVVGHDGTIVGTSHSATEYLGYTREELLELSVSEIIVAFDTARFSDIWERLVPIPGLPITLDQALLRSDKEVGPVELRANLVEVEDRQLMFALARDVAEYRRSERELVRLERLHASGEAIAAYSHNLNNALTGILGQGQLLKKETDDPKLLSRIESILSCAWKAARLVELSYKTSIAENDTELESVPVNELVEEALLSTSPLWKEESEAKGISIKVVAQLENVSCIRGTRPGLRSILFSLLMNSISSMPDGGDIEVSTRNVLGGVQISVSDTGIELDEEASDRIFEPFFSRKGGDGLGLGLFTVYSTVTRWKGTIDVVSRPPPDRNTTITLWLPAWVNTSS